MTREELTAKLRKLTGKTTGDINALDERVDALEAASGGVEFKTLDVTVTFSPFVDTYVGGITSTIPEDVVINDIVKIETLTLDANMPDASQLRPLPVYDLVARNTNFEIQYATWYSWITGEIPDEMREQFEQVYPLLIMFNHMRGVAPEGGSFTMNFRITYI